MSTREDLIQRICTLVDQPLVLVNSTLEVVEANQAFCEVLGVAAIDITGSCIFDLPDGRWNGPELHQVVEQGVPSGEVVWTPEIEWTLGPIGCRMISVSACRVREAGKNDTGLLFAIHERIDSRKRLAKHADMASLLSQAISLAATSDSLSQTLEFCIYAVCALTGWPIGHTFLAPEDDNEPLICTDMWQYPADWDISQLQRETKSAAFRMGVGLPGKVWLSGQICWIEAISDFSEWVRKKSIPPLGIKAAFGFPIEVGGRVRAVLEFFSTRVTPQSPDMVMFCNHMAEPVGRVIERRETTERLREAMEASERASRAKSQFLANISHELRTPMTAVLGMLQRSLEEDLSPEVRDYLHTAQDSANGLLSLLNDILDFADLESGTLNIVLEPLALRQLIDEVVAPYAEIAGGKGLQWKHDVCPDVPNELVGDAVRLRQVIDHLLDNAVKFTERGCVEVQVALGKQESTEAVATLTRIQEEPKSGDHDYKGSRLWLLFTVTDSGPGLPPEDQQRMLEGFTQLDSSFTRRHGGAGLGLAICHALADRMGGRLSIESQVGEGCTFQLQVPFATQEMKAQETSSRSATDVSSSVKEAAPEASRRLSVLLAEDTLANQKVIGSILRKRGHDVTTVANGREAMEHAAKTDFHAILMDLQMPVMDGYQATAAIREQERRTGRHTPIIALTAHSTHRDREACLQAGMDAYLAKPIDVVQLMKVVESIGAVETPQETEIARIWGDVSNGDKPAEPTIDIAATMKRLGGDEELLKQFIDVFDEDSPRLLQQLESAIQEGDCKAVVRAAHSLRGLAANFSATSVVKLASTIEEAAQRNELIRADVSFEQLSSSVDHLRTALEPHRQS